MYAFKPHVFAELSPNNLTRFTRSLKAIVRCDGENLYFYGGSESDIEYYDNHNIWEYNLVTHKWRFIQPLAIGLSPYKGDSIISIMFESHYFIYSTIRNRDLEVLTIFVVCELRANKRVYRITSGEIPNPSSKHSFVRHGKYLYTIGMTKKLGEFSDVNRLNLENLVWESVYLYRGLNASEPVGRLDHTSVYSNNMIYVFGSNYQGPGQDRFSFLRIPAFDLEKFRWKIVNTFGDENHIPHYPTQRGDFGVTSYTDPDSGEVNAIISGGSVDYNDVSNSTLNDVWRLNLISLKWTCLQRFGTVLPRHSYSHSMAISPAGKLFKFGGNILTNDAEQETRCFTLYSTWIRIPKLTDICWEAVFQYFPNLISMTDEEITALGIPLQLFKSRAPLIQKSNLE